MTRATFGVWNEQRKSLSYSIRPHSNVTTLKSACGLVCRIFRLLREFALSTHAFLAVFPSVIEVAQVDANAQDTADSEAKSSLQPLRKRLLSNRINQESERHQTDDEQEVVAHLNMIAQDLHRRKEARHNDSQQVFASVTQHHTSDGWRNEAERQEFPDVSCLYDDEVVTAEGPKNCTKSRHPNAEIERSEHNVEA